MNLTDKQKRFCDEYLANGMNATQAAISAGYSEKTARSIAQENLTKHDIQTYISERQNKVSNKLEVTQERVIKELAKIAFGDIKNLFDDDGQLRPISELEDEVSASIAGIETAEENQAVAEETFKSVKVRKVKGWDKLKALDMLSKHLGLYEKDNEQKSTFNFEVMNVEDKMKLLSLLAKAKDA